MIKKFSNNKILIRDLKKGNEKAYAFLIETYYQALCTYATSLSQDYYKSEDIVQNVIIKTWEQREKLNTSYSLKSFLYRAVYNEFIDQYRKEVSFTALEKKYIDNLNTIYEKKDQEEFEKLISLVKREIELLPPKCKETFLLSKEEGLTYIEIAEYQKVSIKTVENQINKAFKILRKKIDIKVHSVMFLLFNLSPQIVFGSSNNGDGLGLFEQ